MIINMKHKEILSLLSQRSIIKCKNEKEGNNLSVRGTQRFRFREEGERYA